MRLLSAALVLVSAVPIVAATADDAPAPMDLVWDATDVNGVALNPKWIGTTTSLAGHVNWYPGTFEGPMVTRASAARCSTRSTGRAIASR